jgi:hypothetical protein
MLAFVGHNPVLSSGMNPTGHGDTEAAAGTWRPPQVDSRPSISSLLVSALVACSSTPTREALPTLSLSLAPTIRATH